MNRLLLILSATLSLILFSCGKGASPSPTSTVDLEATIQAAVKITLTAQPTKTPTAQPTKTPTAMSTPTPTLTPTLSRSVNQNLCLSTLFFFCLTLLFGQLFLNRGKKIKSLQARLNTEMKNLEAVTKESNSHIQKLKDTIQKQSEDNYFLLREQWLESLSQTFFQSEIEVEVKFIHPLVGFLGYKEHEFDLRVPINLQLGHTSMKGVADLVLWDMNTSSYEHKAFVVVEAKAPNRQLEEFQAQVRSYAFGLDAPIYVITNGKDFQVFRRGVQRDTCVINCRVSSLANNWSFIEQTIGANARNNE